MLIGIFLTGFTLIGHLFTGEMIIPSESGAWEVPTPRQGGEGRARPVLLNVKAVEMDHTVPTVGWVVQEVARPGKLHADKVLPLLKQHEMPLNMLKAFKMGTPITLPTGEVNGQPLLLRLICVYLSIYIFIYRSMYLSVCLSIYLSICLSVYLSIYPSICLSVADRRGERTAPSLTLDMCLSIYIYVSIYVSICLSVYLSIYLSVCLSIYLSIYMSVRCRQER